MAKPKNDIEYGHSIAAGTFTFHCGVTVQMCRIANEIGLGHFVAQVNACQRARKNSNLQITLQAKEDSFNLAERFFLFLAAWGVSTNPPAEAVEELELAFGPSSSPRVRRARWVRFVLLGNLEESSDFVAAQLLTNYGTAEAKQVLAQQQKEEAK